MTWVWLKICVEKVYNGINMLSKNQLNMAYHLGDIKKYSCCTFTLRFWTVTCLIISFDSVQNSRPANIQFNLRGKNSQLDLRPFGVGVPAMGGNVVP